MEFLEIFVIALQITAVVSNKEYIWVDSDDTSVPEGRKDCGRKNEPTTTTVPPELACPCPRMCCKTCCECDTPELLTKPILPFETSQTTPKSLQASFSLPVPPQKPVQPLKSEKKTLREDVFLPMGGRRSFGFTRENIRTLLTHYQDIKKILNELVQVTIEKAYLADKVESRPEVMEVNQVNEDSTFKTNDQIHDQ